MAGREGAGRRGASAPGGTFQGRHFKEGKNIRPVYGHLNALQLSISVHQRCSVTFKMHQIHLWPGLRPIRALGSSPRSLVSWDLQQGGATGRTFAPGATDPRAATGFAILKVRYRQPYSPNPNINHNPIPNSNLTLTLSLGMGIAAATVKCSLYVL